MKILITKKIKNDFARLIIALEPENISQDGELSQKEIQAEYDYLYGEWSKLEKKYNIAVSEDEASDWAWN